MRRQLGVLLTVAAIMGTLAVGAASVKGHTRDPTPLRDGQGAKRFHHVEVDVGGGRTYRWRTAIGRGSGPRGSVKPCIELLVRDFAPVDMPGLVEEEVSRDCGELAAKAPPILLSTSLSSRGHEVSIIVGLFPPSVSRVELGFDDGSRRVVHPRRLDSAHRRTAGVRLLGYIAFERKGSDCLVRLEEYNARGHSLFSGEPEHC